MITHTHHISGWTGLKSDKLNLQPCKKLAQRESQISLHKFFETDAAPHPSTLHRIVHLLLLGYYLKHLNPLLLANVLFITQTSHSSSSTNMLGQENAEKAVV